MVIAVLATGVLHEFQPLDFRVIPAVPLRVTTTVMIGFITVTTALGAIRLVRGILTTRHSPAPRG